VMRIARRRLLQAMLGWMAFAGIPLPARASTRAIDSSRAAALHAHSVDALGRAYLEAHPDDALSGLAERWLRGDGEALRRDIQRDFERANVVWVEGWLLARSEARYCALLLRSR